MLKIDADNGQSYNGKNWAYAIKLILDESGLIFVWENQYNIQVDFKAIKFRILSLYYEKWYTLINNSPRLDTYSLFKHTFDLEKYLSVIKEPKYRIALSRFRTSSHNLAIEYGRYRNIPRNERFCENCKFNQIVDEYHFLLICPKFSDLRKRYLKRYTTHCRLSKSLSI
jgi:hypothetical protein